MTEDTNWLKKNPRGNPFRMSLRRSSRFYAQDMDASIMTNEDKAKNQVLVVSHMPRRSNIPMERIKEMNFRIPAPVVKRSANRNAVTRLSKFQIGRPSFAPPPVGLKAELNKSGLEPQCSKATTSRQSTFWKPVAKTKSAMSTLPSKKCEVENDSESFNQSVTQGATDISLLSQSKVVNQSTPNEPAVLRSILKRNENANGNCDGKIVNSKKSKAAKRCNFNSDVKSVTEGKENEDNAQKVKGELVAKLRFAMPHKPVQGVKKELCDIDEESTEVFSSSFKPITYQESSSEGDDVAEIAADKENEAVKLDVSRDLIRGLMDFWKAYRKGLNDFWTQLQILDQGFQKSCKFVVQGNFDEIFSVYEAKKWKLYEELRDLEQDFRKKVKNSTDINNFFANYIEKKRQIYKCQTEFEKHFENNLQAIAKKHWVEQEEEEEEEKVVTDEGKDTADSTRHPGEHETVSVSNMREVPSVKRRKSGLPVVNKASYPCVRLPRRKLVSPRKRSAKELSADVGSSPDNTPARQKRLSRKIQQQIRSLFEE